MVRFKLEEIEEQNFNLFLAGIEVERIIKEDLIVEFICGSVIESNLMGFHEAEGSFSYVLDIIINTDREKLIRKAFEELILKEKIEMFRIAILNYSRMSEIEKAILRVIKVPIEDFSIVVLNYLDNNGKVLLGEKYLLYKELKGLMK